MMKRTIDERENKLIFLNPVLIVRIGDERRSPWPRGRECWERDSGSYHRHRRASGGCEEREQFEQARLDSYQVPE
ncbi:unnamed protein product [Prunus brigantina]